MIFQRQQLRWGKKRNISQHFKNHSWKDSTLLNRSDKTKHHSWRRKQNEKHCSKIVSFFYSATYTPEKYKWRSNFSSQTLLIFCEKVIFKSTSNLEIKMWSEGTSHHCIYAWVKLPLGLKFTFYFFSVNTVNIHSRSLLPLLFNYPADCSSDQLFIIQFWENDASI